MAKGKSLVEFTQKCNFKGFEFDHVIEEKKEFVIEVQVHTLSCVVLGVIHSCWSVHKTRLTKNQIHYIVLNIQLWLCFSLNQSYRKFMKLMTIL